MSRSAKIVYFFVAVMTMACFALASVLMAQNRPAVAGGLFVLAFLMTGMGFMARARLLKKQ